MLRDGGKFLDNIKTIRNSPREGQTIPDGGFECKKERKISRDSGR